MAADGANASLRDIARHGLDPHRHFSFATPSEAPLRETFDAPVHADELSSLRILCPPSVATRLRTRRSHLPAASSAPLSQGNPAAFHRLDALGYQFWSERVIELDAITPRLPPGWPVRRTAGASCEPYRSHARQAIARVAARTDLTKMTHEVITRPGQ